MITESREAMVDLHFVKLSLLSSSLSLCYFPWLQPFVAHMCSCKNHIGDADTGINRG